MKIEVKIPSVGESVTEAVLAEWFKTEGDTVNKDEPLFVIETDKVTLEVVAEAGGVLQILVAENETVPIGAVVGVIDTAAAVKSVPDEAVPAPAETPAEETPAVAESPPAAPASPEPDSAVAAVDQPQRPPELSPAVRRLVTQQQVDVARIAGTGPGGRITKGDVILHLEQASVAAGEPPAAAQEAALTMRKPMSPIRRRIAARLLEAKQGTAMLTTFNEIDMSRAMAFRATYKEAFKKKFDVSLGFMSFFTRATVEALKEIPEINAYIEDEDMVYHDYCHIGIAIGSPKGLVVPVIRNAQQMGFADIEQAIVDYVDKIRANRLELADLEGGTFTISNGGVFGSLLSTPILNPPQSAILGMHKIEKRPVVVADEIVIRPMMYVALSYDHRIVDGKGAVTFLKRVKEFVEDPKRMLLEI